MSDFLRETEPEVFQFSRGSEIPNNPDLPILYYSDIFKNVPNLPASWFTETFNKNQWTGCWKDGVFSYHHYHSTAHEVLGITSGSAVLKLGGPQGKKITVSQGDLVILPAGAGHCRTDGDRHFTVVGAYPEGQSWDLQRDLDPDAEAIMDKIVSVPLPQSDPVYGPDGPLVRIWNSNSS